MGITNTSSAEEHAVSNWVTSSPEDGGSMFLQNVVTIQETANVKCSNPVFSTHNKSRHFTNKRCLTKDRYIRHSI